MDTEERFDEVGFRAIVARHWHYHRPARNRLWATEQLDNGVMQVEISPIYQEVLGGGVDGLRLWPGFSMNLTNFFAEPDVEVSEVGFRSHCSECTSIPFIGIRGTYKRKPFVAMIHLEPVESEPVEVIDSTTHDVRRKRSAK